MDADEKKWRVFQLRLTSFQAVGKAQSFYVNALAAYLGLVWCWHLLSKGGEVSI
jgi:hypothetical protein